MTIEEKITQFLKTFRNSICDDCLGKNLQLGSGGNRHMARNATAALKTTKDFSKQKGQCTVCDKTKLVTKSVE